MGLVKVRKLAQTPIVIKKKKKFQACERPILKKVGVVSEI